MKQTSETIVDVDSPPILVAGAGVRELISAADIAERERQLGAELAERYRACGSVQLLTVLEGGRPFSDGLAQAIVAQPKAPSVDKVALRLRSYEGTKSNGTVELVDGSLDGSAGKHVLIVEDIIETGATMAWLVSALKDAGAKSVEIATLLHKNVLRPEYAKTLGQTALHVGFEIGPEFVIGYGLDYDGQYRDLPAIYARLSE